MTTSDLDPHALEMARRAFSKVIRGNIKSGELGWKPAVSAAITAYLTAREPGVTGKGRGNNDSL